MRARLEAYPVEVDGVLIGMIDLAQVSAVPERLRHVTQVSDVMCPSYELAMAGPQETLADVVSRAGSGVSSMLVIDDRQVVGVLDLGEIVGWARRMTKLGLASLAEAGETPGVDQAVDSELEPMPPRAEESA